MKETLKDILAELKAIRELIKESQSEKVIQIEGKISQAAKDGPTFNLADPNVYVDKVGMVHLMEDQK